MRALLLSMLARECVAVGNNETLNNGSLGSCNDEERSKVRKAV